MPDSLTPLNPESLSLGFGVEGFRGLGVQALGFFLSAMGFRVKGFRVSGTTLELKAGSSGSSDLVQNSGLLGTLAPESSRRHVLLKVGRRHSILVPNPKTPPS